MRLIGCLLFLFTAMAAQSAEDTIYLDETVITGNQELPRVLYILPWRDMPNELLPQRALDFTSQSVLVPIYPEEHLRELGLRQSLTRAREQLSQQSQVSQQSQTGAALETLNQ